MKGRRVRELASQPVDAAHQLGADGALRDLQVGRYLGVRQVVEIAQHDHRPHPHGQLLKRADQLVPAVDPSVLVTRRGRVTLDRMLGRPAEPPPTVVGEVDHDPPHIRVRGVLGADGAPLAAGPFQGLLDQVLRRVAAARQDECAPEQRGRPGGDESMEVLHRLGVAARRARCPLGCQIHTLLPSCHPSSTGKQADLLHATSETWVTTPVVCSPVHPRVVRQAPPPQQS